MRELCVKVFEAIEQRKGRAQNGGVVYCGKGARVYDVLGMVGGVGLVNWMVGRSQGGRVLGGQVLDDGWEKL